MKDEKLDCLQLIIKRARRFKPLWRAKDYNGAYILCNKIRRETEVPEYNPVKFNEGFQYRTIFHENWKVAKDEFINVVFGWW